MPSKQNNSANNIGASFKTNRHRRAPPPKPEILTSESESQRSQSSKGCSSDGASSKQAAKREESHSDSDSSQSSQSPSQSRSSISSRSRSPSSQSNSQSNPQSQSQSQSQSRSQSHATSTQHASTVNSHASSLSETACPKPAPRCLPREVRVKGSRLSGKTLFFQRPLDSCGNPVVRTCDRRSEFVWKVPRGVCYIHLTATGGGGAGGTILYGGYLDGDVGANQNVAANGAGGQAGAAFVNMPVPVEHGQEVVFYVGAGGNPSSLQQAPLPEVTSQVNYAPSIVNQQFQGVEERVCSKDCRFQDVLLQMAGGQVGVLDETQGAPTIVRIRDAKTKRQVRTVLIAEGGLSGNQVMDPAYNGYLISGRFSSWTNTYGSPGDVTSSTSGAGVPLPVPAPTGLGAMPSQGGTSIFGPGGIPMVTPINDYFSQTVQFSVPIYSYFPNNQQASPHGGIGAGGAGGTNTYTPGRGGDGFVSFSYSVDVDAAVDVDDECTDDDNANDSQSDDASRTWTDAR